jgi:cell division protein ZapA
MSAPGEAVVAVAVRILDKDYQVACPPGERDDLLAAAQYLNTQMRRIRENTRVAGQDRVAVIAALNMANELLKLRASSTGGSVEGTPDVLAPRLRALRERAESVLAQGASSDL